MHPAQSPPFRILTSCSCAERGGVSELRGALIGVLLNKGSYYLWVFSMWVPYFGKPPNVARSQDTGDASVSWTS